MRGIARLAPLDLRQSTRFAASAAVLAALVAMSCSSENMNSTASSGGGAAGTGAAAATGGSGGSATGGAGGSVTGGTGATATGGGAGDAAVDVAPKCGFSGDASAIGKWPDSKTKWCSGTACTGTGQDGDYVLNTPGYAVNANVVKDSITGLEWRKDVIENTAWSAAATSCALLNLGDAGGNLWRLPTRFELMSLLDFGAGGTWLQPAELDPPMFAGSFWTITAVAANANLAWSVSFLTGAVGSSAKTGSLSLRCVRGTPPTPKLEADSGCDVVSDVGLGLMWFRTADSAQYAWADALAHCESLEHAGFDDWRLPSAKELMTIVLDTAAKPAIDASVFGPTPEQSFWTSTPRRSDPTKSLLVDFASGNESFDTASVPHRARCVRSLP